MAQNRTAYPVAWVNGHAHRVTLLMNRWNSVTFIR